MTLYNVRRTMCVKRNLSEEIADIFISDIKLTYEMVWERGLILFLIALTCVLVVSLLKVCHCVWTYFFDSPMTVGQYVKSRYDSDENYISQKTHAEFIHDETVMENENLTNHSYLNKNKKQTVDSLSYLRNYLLTHNFELHAQVIKSVRHKVADDIVLEYMHTGKILKPYLTEFINFGEKINNALKDILNPKITLKKTKDCPYPCIITYNGEIDFIKEDLSRLFLHDINIKFDTIENKLYN